MVDALTCFKYRDAKTALRSLTGNSLYFAKPSQLNDTLEAKFDPVTPEAFLQVMSDTLNEISQQRGGEAFEFDPQRNAELSSIYAAENEKHRDAVDRMGIFSAASRPDHQAMWAYYADNAAGVCFELHWSREILAEQQIVPVPVTYDNAARIHNRAHDWRRVFLELAKEHPAASLEELQQLSLEEPARQKQGILTASRAASAKHTDWAHEQEIRLLKPVSGEVQILRDVLKRVHFVHTDSEHWGAIMKILFTDYKSVELVHWTFSHGKLTSAAQPMEFRRWPMDSLGSQ